MQNVTAFLVDKQKIELRESPMPVMGADDVLVEVTNIGVCGSDLMLYADPLDPGVPFDLPMVLGHEASGRVIDMGANVKDFQIGDHVVFEPGVPCGHCKHCKEGRYNLCENLAFMGPPVNNGTLSKYVAHPASMTYKLPSTVSLSTGALVEPMAVAMHAVKRAGVKMGETVAILGCGCIGLCVLMVCKAMGVETVFIADLMDTRLAKARELGASEVINSGKSDLVETINALTHGQGADVVFETAGSAVTAAMTPDLVAKGGRIMMVGNIHKPATIDFFKLNFKEANILLTFRYCNDFPAVISGIASGALPAEKIITHRYRFEDAQKAFDTALNDKNNAVKVVIDV